MEYHTAYRVFGSTKLNIAACFSEQFNKPFDFTLQLYRDDRFKEEQIDHNVILPNKDINLFLRILKQEFGGITSSRNKVLESVQVCRYDEEDCLDNVKCKEVTVKFNKCSYTNELSQKTVYKTLCTYLRYLYEKPFNELLKRAIKAYRKNDRIHLLTYLYHAHKNKGYNSGHSVIGYYGTESRTKFVPIEDTSFKYVDCMSNVITLSSAHYHNHKLTDKEFKQVKKLIQW